MLKMTSQCHTKRNTFCETNRRSIAVSYHNRNISIILMWTHKYHPKITLTLNEACPVLLYCLAVLISCHFWKKTSAGTAKIICAKDLESTKYWFCSMNVVLGCLFRSYPGQSVVLWLYIFITWCVNMILS